MFWGKRSNISDSSRSTENPRPHLSRSNGHKPCPGLRIAIIDDDKAYLRSLQIVLTQRGCKVLTFSDPDEACCVFEHECQIDVLIIDYLLPCENGLQNGLSVLQRLRSCLPSDCIVILASGHSDKIEPLNLEEAGVHAYLQKPIDLDLLCELISRNNPAFTDNG